MSDVVHIGLGANLGDRVAAVFEAIERLDESDNVSVVRVSTLLESDPVDVVDQPCFVNAVVSIRTTLPPEALLATLLEVEHAMGRRRDGVVPRGPRSIDLDILLWGDVRVDTAKLTVPHPRLHERAFVLVPLVEIDETLQHPVLNETMAVLLEQEIKCNGPVELRCRMLMRGSLQDDSALDGPRMEEDA
jgi:2-amino-4-hydroxy-6-hydroxymethyldihydropteridine diphosphokinase